MPAKATSAHHDYQNHDVPVPYSLSPLAIEDLTDTPVYRVTPAGRAEIDLEQTVTLTPGLLSHLDKFTAARKARERARGKDLLPALTAEEQAAIQLAWALENAVNRGV